jgi:Flp pilus assembly protein TadB
MAFLPLLVGGGLALLDPDSMSKLISTPVGYAVSTVIVVMQVLGYVFINKTISIDT